MIIFKAKGKSESVLVSFSKNHMGNLTDGSILHVIRKRYPTMTPLWLYTYINSPKSAVIGRARIRTIMQITSKEALNFQKELFMTANELSEYCKGYKRLGIYVFEYFQKAQHEVTLSALRSAGRFFPPQSFMYLSTAGEEHITKVAQFK